MSSSQVTNSYFSEGLVNHQPVIVTIIYIYILWYMIIHFSPLYIPSMAVLSIPPIGCFCTPLFHVFIRGLCPDSLGLRGWRQKSGQSDSLSWHGDGKATGLLRCQRKMASLFHGFQGFTHPHIPHIPHIPYIPHWLPHISHGKMLEIPAQELLDRDPNKRPPAASSSDHPWSSPRGWNRCKMQLVSWGLELMDKKSVHFNAIDAIDVMLM